MAEAESKPSFVELLDEARSILTGSGARDVKLNSVCLLLAGRVSYYNWVGFYLREPSGRDELVLGPYVGGPTDHTRIPLGRGICGQAAVRKETFVVQDVSKETNYLSCGARVKSEIVVPIMKGSEVAGELDIDSHALEPFTDEDRQFLEAVAAEVAKIL